MRRRIQKVLTFVFPLYLGTVLFTNVSLSGFWTDVAFSLFLSLTTAFIWVKEKGKNSRWRIVNVMCLFVTVGILGWNIMNPFMWDVLKLRSFCFQKVDNRVFNAYFKPVGSYSGGYGNFWITETLEYFPLIEWRVYWDRTVEWDFRCDTFDGKQVDNYEIVRIYIREEVIKDGSKY